MDALREELKAQGLKPRYDGTCRERGEAVAGVDPVVRFKNPLHGEVAFDDMVLGPITVSNEELDDLNAEILMLLHERGIAAPSSTVLNSKFSIRVAICNHRSKRADFDALVDAVVAIGAELTEND